MASPPKYPPEPLGLKPAGAMPPWARRLAAWRVVLVLIDGRWRWAVLRGWFTPDSGVKWCAALEFVRLDTDLPANTNPWKPVRPGPDDDGVVRAWWVYSRGWLLPAPDVPADWTGPTRAPAPNRADARADN